MLFQVKTIAMIVCMCVIWGLIPGSSCSKDRFDAVRVIMPSDGYPSMTAPADTVVPAFLALGDSYTIGESVAAEDGYPVQAVRLLDVDQIHCRQPDIIAATGWTTGNLLYAMAQPGIRPTHTYTIVTLLIGVNNQYQGRSQSEYHDQFISLLNQSIALAGNKASHVIVLSIPDYSVTPFARGRNLSLIAAQIDSFNIINTRLSRDYSVHYINVTAESRKGAKDPTLIASDGLHFSGKEYAIWAQMMEPVMKDILKR